MCAINIGGRLQLSFAHRNGRMLNPKGKFNIENGVRKENKV
jgi:hypothetical protein